MCGRWHPDEPEATGEPIAAPEKLSEAERANRLALRERVESLRARASAPA